MLATHSGYNICIKGLELSRFINNVTHSKKMQVGWSAATNFRSNIRQ